MIWAKYKGKEFRVRVFHYVPGVLPKSNKEEAFISAEAQDLGSKPYTEVSVLDSKGKVKASYKSVCNHGDDFFRAFGRRWAFEKAVSKIRSRGLRVALWNAYFKACKDGPVVMNKVKAERKIAAQRNNMKQVVKG